MRPASLRPERRLPHAAWAALTGFALTCLCFYPGSLNPDAESSLYQAQVGVYFDWHPPAIAWIWSWLDAALPGPGGMYLLQLVGVWLGLALAITLLLGRRRVAWAVVLGIGLAPPLLAQATSIWKDLLMAGPLLCAWALLLLAARRWLAWPLVAALPCLLLATLVRHNAPPATLPLALWWGALACRRWSSGSRGRALVFGAALWLAVTGAAFAINRGLTDRRASIYQHLLLFDLAGISLESGELLLPRYQQSWPRSPRTLAELETVYDPRNSSTLMSIPPDAPPLRPTGDPRELAELRLAWRSAIRRHPGAYLAHRARVVLHAWGWLGSPQAEAFWPVDPATVGPVGRAAAAGLEALRNTWLFRGWPYLLLLLSLAGVLTRRPPSVWRTAGWALILSAALYVLPFLAVITAKSVRYLYWPILASLVGLVTVAAQGRRPEAARAP